MLDALAERALALCEPSRSEERRIRAVAEEAKALVDKYVESNNDIVHVVFGGSFAKGTWLKGDADIDIFFKVRHSVPVEKFEAFGRSVGKEALRLHSPRLRYSDHPYVEALMKNVRINVVPCYDVEQGKWQSAADRSPFHTEFIRKNFDDNKRRHARLLKKFLKSIGIYGAEISTGGLSGYVSEVLALKYGSFEGVLQAAADWQERQVVSVGDYDQDIVMGFNSQVIIIDPVDCRRNLGTAISPESAGRFILAARAFLNKPTIKFFKGDRHRPEAKKLVPNVLVVEFSYKERSPDIIWGQLKRSTSAIARQLELADFIVLRSSCFTDEVKSAAMAFLLKSVILSPYAKKKGPQIFRRYDSASFLAGKKKSLLIWVDKEMRITMLLDRKEIYASRFVKSLLQRKRNNGVARNLISGKLQIYSGDERKVRGVAREAVRGVISTESLIFG